jgi:hypothetical protein
MMMIANRAGEPHGSWIRDWEAAMPKIRAVQVGKKGGPFELVERELPQRGRATLSAEGSCVPGHFWLEELYKKRT